MDNNEKLLLAQELIEDLCDHEGAEGFSESTRELLKRWEEANKPPMVQGRTAAEIGAWITERDRRFEEALEEAKGLASAASEEDFSRSVALVFELCPAMSADKQADFMARAFWPVVERARQSEREYR
jgi:hypothetical protein